MTDTAKTLEDLQREVEMAKLQRELEDLRVGSTKESEPVMVPTGRDVKSAAVRQVLCGFSHAFFGPIASVYYSAKVGNWIPTAAATGIAVLSVPVVLIDFGFTLAVAPPITSALLVITDSKEKRRKLGIVMPEEADAMLAKFKTY